MSELSREMTTLNSEKKLSEMAIKGQQNEMAKKLRGYMGQDIKNTLEKKEKEKNSFWGKIKTCFDNILRVF